MQIQEAINLVQAKFMAESKGETEGESADKYSEAFASFPVMMEVATYIFAQGLITQNYQAAMQRAQREQQQKAAAAPPAPGGTA